MRIFAIIVSKELLSFLRSVALVIMVLYSFTIDIYVAGSGIQLKPKNVVVGYVDETGGGISQKILTRLHKPEFKTPVAYTSQKALSQAIFNKEVMVGMIFESDFEKNFRDGKVARLNFLLDATAASQALTTLVYIQNIILDFQSMNLPLKIKTHKLFNENAEIKVLWL